MLLTWSRWGTINEYSIRYGFCTQFGRVTGYEFDVICTAIMESEVSEHVITCRAPDLKFTRVNQMMWTCFRTLSYTGLCIQWK